MSRWLKITLIAVAVIFGLLLSTMAIVPWQVKKQGQSWIAENTSRNLVIEKVSFNPFTLTLEINGTKLTEQNSGQSFVTFSKLLLSGSLQSIFRQAIVLDRVELDNPFINVELLGKQEFNFSDFTRLGSDNPEPVTTEPKEPLHFSFNNIILTNGKIDFTDKTTEKESQHQIRELTVTVPFVGNIPYLTDDYVEPMLRMLLNGAEVKAQGKLKPFQDSLETKLYLTLDHVDLAFYAFHSPVPLPIEVKQGILDGEIDLSYQISAAEQPRLMLGGELALSDIDLRELDGRELFRMPTMILDLDWANLFTQDFNLVSLDIIDPELYIDRDQSGRWNFQRIIPAQHAVVAEEPKKGEAQSLPLLTIESLALIDAKVHYRDAFVPGGFAEEISAINLNLDHVSTHAGQLTATSLKFKTGRDFITEISGDLGINPVMAAMDLRAENLPLKPYYPYLEELFTAPIEGTFSLTGQVFYSADGNIQVQQGNVNLRNLRVPFTDTDQFTLANFRINNSSFDLQQQLINLGAIELDQGEIKATRLADGSLSPQQLLRAQPEKKAAVDTDNEIGAPWNIHVASVDLTKFNLLLTDQSLVKQPHIDIPDFNFHAENLSYPAAEKSPFTLSAQVGKAGKIQISGAAVHTPLQLQAQTTMSAFPLVLLNDFVPENLNLSLKDGRFYSTLAIKLEQQPDKLSGSFSGKLNIEDFDLRDPIGSGELLAWENLTFAGIKGEISPFSLHMTDVVLNDYLANIQITPEGQVNLSSLTTAQTTTATKEPDNNSSAETVAIEEKGLSEPPPDISIDALTLQGGTVSFIDRHLPETFSTTMYKLGGRVTGLSSAEEMQADVDLRGQLENHSPLTISGKINPLSRDLYTDLTFSFQEIDLTPMTPYSGTYLGYVIDRGKLYLDLNYQIEHQKIAATNKVMIDQFTFGDTVQSEKATSLPVAFAISLLKDSNGEIHLDIPVSGDMNDPNFSISGVIFTVLRNLLVKAATSPFSLLAATLGGDEDFTAISFAPGIATLDDKQQGKLKSLADMLAQRPALILEISAFADKKLDPEGYRQEQLRQMLVRTKQQKLAEEGSTLGTQEEIVISDAEYPDILLAVYEAAEFPRPRNFIGMLKKLPVPEMEKLLLANIIVDEEQLEELAKMRAMVVRDALVAANEEIKPRLFLKKEDIYQAPKDGPISRVEFNISSK
ncbi:protein of unknown function [Desulfuromusa kysingii]|uniref:AsmA family protein n=1 Tax=Desulfuromusa kysingii TaxID=37625 RepID=A0A1H3VFF7_9BACT|nr:DUF748 domain-containing protein [Desulfuromusa kysingii]SDZ73523.1 protein of unknown function [Desulfuromusa kysingii]